jgi:pyridoxamine 5'-phosphate oxidase
MNGSLADLRREYSLKSLSESTILADPFGQFSVWMEEAIRSEIIDASAMTVSTADENCRPTARVVLLKEFDNKGFVFYTNYESEKGSDLAANPHISLHFFWPQLERQIAICGTARKTSREESSAYFNSRPLESRLSAIASRQSAKIRSRVDLEAEVENLRRKYADSEPPCPENWGGFRVAPESFEFWQGRANRLHDRIRYELKDHGWEFFRLAP